ncbi:hypothetical protein BDB00DRAFT_232148 [Zychaea mexicana]|uniref:uncharacterized protein n=1 Tax=Zychaea mexicana TaxID=64656 RepID=UPI0022FF2B77|nr:uncharacterized protein BDB00DRAFT_232148 [Zychaea mexicana]KAI9499379.1 hypothetical protein BDB00DRAFT_232148 [Zychaea mexicana]
MVRRSSLRHLLFFFSPYAQLSLLLHRLFQQIACLASCRDPFFPPFFFHSIHSKEQPLIECTPANKQKNSKRIPKQAAVQNKKKITMALSVADTLNTELDMTPTAFTQLVTERHTSTEVTEEKYQLLKRRLKEITEVTLIRHNSKKGWAPRPKRKKKDSLGKLQKNESLTNDLSRAKKRLRRLAKEKKLVFLKRSRLVGS